MSLEQFAVHSGWLLTLMTLSILPFVRIIFKRYPPWVRIVALLIPSLIMEFIVFRVVRSATVVESAWPMIISNAFYDVLASYGIYYAIINMRDYYE